MMVNSAAWHVEVNNDLKSFMTRLDAFDKNVSKILRRDMKRGANLVTKEAKGIIRSGKNPPLSNWGKSWTEADRRSQDARSLRWVTGDVLKGIKTQPNKVTRDRVVQKFGFDVVQMNAVGSIYELAGSRNKTSNYRRAGSKSFNTNLLKSSAGTGPYPRTLFPAYYAAMPQVKRDIEAAIRAAEKAVGK
jgi:hypothetical protein